jgi:eukaryotic-like serine/threonine-protein kinase
MIQPFDAKMLELKGEPFPLFEDAGLEPNFSISQNGVLGFVKSDLQQFIAYDRQGKVLTKIGKPWLYDGPFSLSPDEKYLTVARYDPAIGNDDLWLVELSRSTFLRFTFESTSEHHPVWSPDGSQIAFCSNLGRVENLYSKASNGTGPTATLLKSKNPKCPFSWSSDGKYVAYVEENPNTKNDIWILPLFGERKPYPYLQSNASENSPSFSPNGKWIAYVSNETGKAEVYVRGFPITATGKWQISTEGGYDPSWRKDGKELYYVASNERLMSVATQTGGSFEFSTPTTLLDERVQRYTVSGDGQRIYAKIDLSPSGPPPITLFMNWPALLKK